MRLFSALARHCGRPSRRMTISGWRTMKWPSPPWRSMRGEVTSSDSWPLSLNTFSWNWSRLYSGRNGPMNGGASGSGWNSHNSHCVAAASPASTRKAIHVRRSAMAESLADVAQPALRVKDEVGHFAHGAGAAVGARQVVAVPVQERVRVGDTDGQAGTL